MHLLADITAKGKSIWRYKKCRYEGMEAILEQEAIEMEADIFRPEILKKSTNISEFI